MLIKRYTIMGDRRMPLRQRGVVLVIVLIVLIAMTLAGIALMRSVNSTTLVAGNLAFKQAALRAADFGTESAIAFLKGQSGAALNNDISTKAYFASLQDPGAGQSWDDYWKATLDPHPLSRPVTSASISGKVWTLPTDPTDPSSGNTVSYVIHRMCKDTGEPATAQCTVSPSSSDAGNSKAALSIPVQHAGQVYYRITTRVDGPHNTVSFIQTVVAL